MFCGAREKKERVDLLLHKYCVPCGLDRSVGMDEMYIMTIAISISSVTAFVIPTYTNRLLFLLREVYSVLP